MTRFLTTCAIYLALATGALAQCNGVFAPNTFCGNTGGSAAPPGQMSLSVIPGGNPGGSNGQIQYNNASAFGGFTLSGDCTVVTSTGVITCTKTNGVTLGPAATDNPVTIAHGGTSSTTASAAASAIFPTPTRAGDIAYWNGSNWVALAGNNSGTASLTENSSGVPAWSTTNTPYTDSATVNLVADFTSHSDGAMGSGSAVLTSATGTFTSADVGKSILVYGAAASGNDLATTIITFTSATQVTLNATNASGGAVSGKFYAYGTDNGPLINTALTTMNKKGTLWIRPGNYAWSTLIDLSGCAGFTIKGTGSNGSGGFIGSRMMWIGSSASNGILFGSGSTGCAIDSMGVHDEGSHTVNSLIRIQNTTGTDPSQIMIVNNTISSFSTACILINLDKSEIISIENNSFGGCNSSINLASANYVIGARIINNFFANSGVFGGAEALTLIGNICEPAANGVGAKFSNISGFPWRGAIISGNWFGDVTANSGAWFDVYVLGANWSGNRISGNNTGDGILIESGAFVSRGFSITGNSFNSFAVGIGTTGTPNGGIICGNAFDSVTTNIGTMGASVLSASCNN